jgi:hypothetical protein
LPREEFRRRIVAAVDGEGKLSYDLVQTSIRNAETPDVLEPRDVFLVSSSGRHNEGTPWSVVVVDKTICLELMAELDHYFGLMGAVARRFTADRRHVACIDTAGETTDVLLKTLFGETVPMAPYNVGNLVSIWTESPFDVRVELFLVDRWIELDRVCAHRKRVDGLANRATALFVDQLHSVQ